LQFIYELKRDDSGDGEFDLRSDYEPLPGELFVAVVFYCSHVAGVYRVHQ